MPDIEYMQSARPRTLQAMRGFDLMRRIRDNVQACHDKGPHFMPDLIALSGEAMADLQCCWLEMAPANTPMPQDIAGIPYQVAETRGYRYAFLREFKPHEKREALSEGKVLYGDGHKALIATEDK
jgi:hypothetical protein